MILSARGRFMRRHDSGAGCGACGSCFASMSPGTLRVTVRSYYEGLPSMAGLGQASVDESPRARVGEELAATSQEARSRRAKSPPRSVERRAPDDFRRAPGGWSARQRVDCPHGVEDGSAPLGASLPHFFASRADCARRAKREGWKGMRRPAPPRRAKPGSDPARFVFLTRWRLVPLA